MPPLSNAFIARAQDGACSIFINHVDRDIAWFDHVGSIQCTAAAPPHHRNSICGLCRESSTLASRPEFR